MRCHNLCDFVQKLHDVREVPFVRCHNLCDFVQKLHDVREDHNKLILKLSWKIGLL